MNDLSCGLEQEAQWLSVLAPFELRPRVAGGLIFGYFQIDAFRVPLGFDDAYSFRSTISA